VAHLRCALRDLTWVTLSQIVSPSLLLRYKLGAQMSLPIQMGPHILELEAQHRWMMLQRMTLQTESSNHHPFIISAGVFPQEDSNGMRSSGIASSGGRFSVSMLESTPEHKRKEFVTLMRHYETPNALVKGELYPSLLAKVKIINVRDAPQLGRDQHRALRDLDGRRDPDPRDCPAGGRRRRLRVPEAGDRVRSPRAVELCPLAQRRLDLDRRSVLQRGRAARKRPEPRRLPDPGLGAVWQCRRRLLRGG
jgi:hypothetical protein